MVKIRWEYAGEYAMQGFVGDKLRVQVAKAFVNGVPKYSLWVDDKSYGVFPSFNEARAKCKTILVQN